MLYAIVIEKAANNYTAYVPDLPGCVATEVGGGEMESHIARRLLFILMGFGRMGLRFRSRPAWLSIWKSRREVGGGGGNNCGLSRFVRFLFCSLVPYFVRSIRPAIRSS